MFKKLFGVKQANILSNAEVEKAMTTVDGKKLGESDEMLLYGGFQELNNYYFFEALFMSVIDLRSKNGATVTFKAKKGDFTLQASIQEFESDPVKSLQRNATQISFDIEKNQIKKIQQGAYDSIELKVKKRTFMLLKS